MRGTRLNLTNFSLGTGEITNLSTNIFFKTFSGRILRAREEGSAKRGKKKRGGLLWGKEESFSSHFPMSTP